MGHPTTKRGEGPARAERLGRLYTRPLDARASPRPEFTAEFLQSHSATYESPDTFRRLIAPHRRGRKRPATQDGREVRRYKRR